jgi:hypothetical protein
MPKRNVFDESEYADDVRIVRPAPSDVDRLLFRLAARDCERMASNIEQECSEEKLSFDDSCAVCQARRLLQPTPSVSVGEPSQNMEIHQAFNELKARFPGERVTVEIEYSPTFEATRFNVTLPDYTGVSADSLEQCMAIIPSMPAAATQPAQPDAATERDFLDASIAVWREIDKGGPPLDSSVELRKVERAAWERYRAILDNADAPATEEGAATEPCPDCVKAEREGWRAFSDSRKAGFAYLTCEKHRGRVLQWEMVRRSSQQDRHLRKRS